MQKNRLQWKVGLFVLVALGIIAALIIQFSKGTSFFRPTYKIYLVAKNVGGLKRNAQVLMAGVQVGNVSEINLGPSGTSVTITLSIYDKYLIHQDAQFLIQQSGFLGDQYVAIVPTANEAPVFQPGAHARAEEPFNLQEVARSAAGFIQRVDETAKKLNDAIADVRRLVLNEQTLTNLAVTVASMRTASERAVDTVDNLNNIVETNGQSFASAMSNMVYFSQQLNEFTESLGGVLNTNSAELTSAMKNIESSTQTLKDLLSHVQSGQGLAGAVLTDPTLASNVQAIAENLSVTTSNLNERGLWGILWAKKHPKPPPSEEKPVLAPRHPLH